MPTVSNEDFNLDGIALPMNFPYRAYELERNWEQLVGLGTEEALPRGGRIPGGASPDCCYLVLEGMVASISPHEDAGRTSAFFRRGSLFLESNALSHLPSNIVFEAAEDCRLVRIPAEALKSAMMRDSEVFDLVTESISRKFFAANERLRESESLDVRMRIYLMLLGFARDCNRPLKDGWHRIDFKLTQQTIADMLAVNRVTANTAMRDLNAKGLVRKARGLYEVCDRRRLLG